MAASPPPVALVFLLTFALVFLFLFLKPRHKKKPSPEAQPPETPAPQTLPKWTPPPSQTPSPPPPHLIGDAEEEEEGAQHKRRKRRGRKKRQEAVGGPDGGEEARVEEAVRRSDVGGREKATDCPFPFSSFASATQRKIKSQYDELVRSNQAKALTVAQVGQFINCLVEARNELQHKSETLQRSFKIKKALLFKADRSSFDRLCQQIYKLEAEHKRLEEDAAVYNLLQEQLKVSPAYQTMLEISAEMEKDPTEQATEFPEISFEELLAQEKKDSFWQRNGKFRSVAS